MIRDDNDLADLVLYNCGLFKVQLGSICYYVIAENATEAEYQTVNFMYLNPKADIHNVTVTRINNPDEKILVT